MRILVFELPLRVAALFNRWVEEKIKPAPGYDELDVETFKEAGELVIQMFSDLLKRSEYWNLALLNQQLQNALVERENESGSERDARLQLAQVSETLIAELQNKVDQQQQTIDDIMLTLKSDSKASVSRNVLRGFPVTTATIKSLLLERMDLKRQIRDLQRRQSRDIRLAGDRNTRKVISYILDQNWPEWKKVDWLRQLSLMWASGGDITTELLKRAEFEAPLETPEA